MSEKRYQLEVKYNNLATNGHCGICGRRTDPAVGPELFLKGTWSPVCPNCVIKYAPEKVSQELQRERGKVGLTMVAVSSGEPELPDLNSLAMAIKMIQADVAAYCDSENPDPELSKIWQAINNLAAIADTILHREHEEPAP